MSIKEINFYHGSVFARLVNSGSLISLEALACKTKGFYLLNNKIPLHIKYTTKKLSPWNFSFQKQHQDDFQECKDEYGVAFIIFVCGQDGICCMEFDRLKHILDYVHEETEGVAIRRRKGEKYSVSGCDGMLKGKIADGDFPKIVIAALNDF